MVVLLSLHVAITELLLQAAGQLRFKFRPAVSTSTLSFQSNVMSFKGIVHPKMKILSSFTHPQSSSKPVWISLFCRAQRKIFWRKFVTRLFWGTIDFHSRKKKYYGSQWCPRTALFPTFFRISSFVFSRTRHSYRTWNYLRVSNWWQNFHFWVNYPFKRSAW